MRRRRLVLMFLVAMVAANTLTACKGGDNCHTLEGGGGTYCDKDLLERVGAD